MPSLAKSLADASLAPLVTGPSSATDNAVSRFDGTTGKKLQDSLVTIDDAGNVALPASRTVDGRDVSADGAQLDTNTSAITMLQANARGFRGVNAQTGTSYTAVLDDAGKLITHSNGSASTFTAPPNSSVAFATGEVLTYLQTGAGATTLTPGSGVTINAPPGKTLVTNGAGAMVSLVKTATNTWYAYGDLVPA